MDKSKLVQILKECTSLFSDAKFTGYMVPESVMDATIAALQPGAWISCAERLPTEADEYVWVWDADIKAPAIEIWSQVVMFRDRYDYTHWMPTGLTRPQPPEGVQP